MDNKIITGDEPITPLYSFGNIPQNKEERALVEGGSLYSGLTIRQEFARSAMQAIISKNGTAGYSFSASLSVKIADALIEALNQTAP